MLSPSVAAAQPSTTPPYDFSAICRTTSGTAISGNYTNLTVTGAMYVADGTTLNVSNNLTIAAGACLDAFSLGLVHVGQNVTVQNGATLALGCAPGANGPAGTPPCNTTTTNDTVGGSIIGNAPLAMYLTAVKVGRDVISNGGGPGPFSPSNPSAAGISFPVKSMKIGGNLELQGYNGAWIGALRNTVGGSMVIKNNTGYRRGDSGGLDSTEIVDNTVGGNLSCSGNTPPAQFGDTLEDPLNGNGYNIVGGQATGECAAISK
ncbi:MAG: hypothetical protein JO057_27860 [Chloroflexi bacterium]|nr:hypothetical protein [Chloroflexota bacterium]